VLNFAQLLVILVIDPERLAARSGRSMVTQHREDS
jgi:hypothetical protein